MLAAVGRARSRVAKDPEWWVKPLRWLALAVWVGIPILALVAQPIAGRVVWSIVITALPLFIVLVGYHRWRRICPLAFWNQIMVRLNRPGRRRVGAAFEEHYYFVPLVLFAVALWSRLVWSNGDGVAIAMLWGALSVLAFGVGVLFTGKTWCNYICPVSFIEKIYTEPHGLRETRNSQCAKCTACKKACPDINQENGYWKEIESPSKRFAYFAFPGLVFGFFLYFWAQAGTWDAFFDGAWTDQPGLWQTAFLPPGTSAASAGFFFLPAVPRAVAALVTLATCALVSVGLFSLVEPAVGRFMRRRNPSTGASRVRHSALALAAFTAFTTFYSFAAQPLLRTWPWLAACVGIAVVVVATLSLVRRLTRTHERFAEQALARNIIKRWSWGDTPPPTDLHEAYIVHTARTTERRRAYAEVLEAYEGAVRETLASGFITRAEVQRLETLRTQLNIKKVHHDLVMSDLAEEERAQLTDPTKQASIEKRLQMDTYSRALERWLESTHETVPDDSFVRQLRREFGVSGAEHMVALDRLLGNQPETALRVAYSIRVIETAAHAIRVTAGAPGQTNDAFMDAVRRERARAVDRLMNLTSGTNGTRAIRDGLCSDEPILYEAALAAVRGHLPGRAVDTIATAHADASPGSAALRTPSDIYAFYTSDPNPHVRALALYALSERGVVDPGLITPFRDDEHALVRETAGSLGHARSDDHAVMPTIEKMIALRGVPIFASLSPEDLEELARSSVDSRYSAGGALCLEGEPGDEVFILLEGEAAVVRHASSDGELLRVEQPGSVIGELAILDPAPRSASIFASSDVRVLRLSGAAFQGVLNADPAVAEGVMRTLARRSRPRPADARLDVNVPTA
jgi:Cyclic nucleotide-binding domain